MNQLTRYLFRGLVFRRQVYPTLQHWKTPGGTPWFENDDFQGYHKWNPPDGPLALWLQNFHVEPGIPQPRLKFRISSITCPVPRGGIFTQKVVPWLYAQTAHWSGFGLSLRICISALFFFCFKEKRNQKEVNNINDSSGNWEGRKWPVVRLCSKSRGKK